MTLDQAKKLARVITALVAEDKPGSSLVINVTCNLQHYFRHPLSWRADASSDGGTELVVSRRNGGAELKPMTLDEAGRIAELASALVSEGDRPLTVTTVMALATNFPTFSWWDRYNARDKRWHITAEARP